MIPLVTFVTFLLCFALIYGTYWAFVLRPETQVAGVVRRRLKKDHARQVARSQLLKQVQTLSSIGAVDALLKRGRSRTERLQILIDQAGLKITVGTLLLVSMGVGAVLVFHSLSSKNFDTRAKTSLGNEKNPSNSKYSDSPKRFMKSPASFVPAGVPSLTMRS